MTTYDPLTVLNLEDVNFVLEFIRNRLFTGDIEILDYESHGTPDTEKALTHHLGHVPLYYIVLSQDKAGSLYLGGTTWTNTTAYFKCSVATVTFKVLLF